jgi:hypothetical protein
MKTDHTDPKSQQGGSEEFSDSGRGSPEKGLLCVPGSLGDGEGTAGDYGEPCSPTPFEHHYTYKIPRLIKAVTEPDQRRIGSVANLDLTESKRVKDVKEEEDSNILINIHSVEESKPSLSTFK